MNPKLQPVIDRFEKATPELQERVLQIITMTIGEDGQDEYGTFVRSKLEQADREIDAGLGRPLDEAFSDIQRDMKAKYGTV